MCNFKQNRKNYLFHFTNSEKLQPILKCKKLRVNILSNVNDPLEALKNSEFSYKSNCEDKCNPEIILQKLQKVHSLIYLCCFSTDYDLPQMWYKYAQQFKGGCLVFDKNKIEKEFDKIRVIYKKKGVVSYKENLGFKSFINYCEKDNDNEEKFFERYLDSLFEKLNAWEDEKEYRLLLQIDPNDSECRKDYYEIDVSNCLEGVIFFENFLSNSLREDLNFRKEIQKLDTKLKIYLYYIKDAQKFDVRHHGTN